MSTLEEKITVMQEFQRGEKVYCRKKTDTKGLTVAVLNPIWDWNTNEYFILPAGRRQITLRCYYTGKGLLWLPEGSPITAELQRVPAEDKIIEVER
jgi:hypothetical protein